MRVLIVDDSAVMRRILGNAMFQMGGEYQADFHPAMSEALVLSRFRPDRGSSWGSWDPSGPWGFAGGRIYSTAMCLLGLEAYRRYERVLGKEVGTWEEIRANSKK